MLAGNGKGKDGDGGHHQNQRTDWFCARARGCATVSRFMMSDANRLAPGPQGAGTLTTPLTPGLLGCGGQGAFAGDFAVLPR
jgi:hypothetical protein